MAAYLLRTLAVCLFTRVIHPLLATSTMHGAYFSSCPKGQVSKDASQQMLGRSQLDCFRTCSRMTECSGVNVCPNEVPKQVSCRLLETVAPDGCGRLKMADSPSCFLALKLRVPEELMEPEMRTPEIVCQNGGTPNGNQCNCTDGYTGSVCERLFRDCTEMNDNGYEGRNYGIYLIQPITSPVPFEVYCSFYYGGVTQLFIRYDKSYFNQNWATCMGGFGDLGQNSYFIGLENMHHFLRQAVYQLQVFVLYGNESAWAFYDNFTLGPESTSYAVTFSQFRDFSTADNGFSQSAPLKFSADGNDVNECFQVNKMAGWYGADCTGFSMFADGSIIWPVKGQNISLYVMLLNVVRFSSYYDL